MTEFHAYLTPRLWGELGDPDIHSATLTIVADLGIPGLNHIPAHS